MKKREEKIDKFITKIWKRVKGLWQVLQPLDRLPYSRVESDDKSPAEWPNSDEVRDKVKSESNRST